MGIDADRRVVLGRIVGVFGIKGWVKLESWTRPAENILDYPEWLLGRAGNWQVVQLQDGRLHNRGLVAQLRDAGGRLWDDRDLAARLVGSEIAVLRSQMPPPAKDEFYWFDLVGLEVENQAGRPLGRVIELFETPAHDMLVVGDDPQYMIPCVAGAIVQSVDLEAGKIRVAWDPEALI